MSLQSHAHDADVVTVTTARLSHTDDIALRERRYVRTQLVRVVCVILGVALPIPVVFRLLLFVGAVLLPWALGLLVVGPWLGHASWHAYRASFSWPSPEPA